MVFVFVTKRKIYNDSGNGILQMIRDVRVVNASNQWLWTEIAFECGTQMCFGGDCNHVICVGHGGPAT